MSMSVFVVPLLFRAPSDPAVGPGCAVGGGPPASRPRRELRSARRLVVRPGPATVHGCRSQALPPPTGTAARRCHRPRAPQPGPATAHGCRSQVLPRSPAMPSGPSGALHAGGAGSLMCALRVDSLSGQASPPPTGAAVRPRLEARPCPATAHGRRSQASPRSSPGPSGPSGALHAGGACVSGMPGPRRRLWVLRRVLVKEISPQLGALVRGTALH